MLHGYAVSTPSRLLTSGSLRNYGARLFGSGLLCIVLLATLAACAGPAGRQELKPEENPLPQVVTTTGIAEFLSRELLGGIAETRMLGPVVPRERRAEPTPDEEVRIARATMVVAYGGAVDANATEMVRRLAPNTSILTIRDTANNNNFTWLLAGNLREDARNLHGKLLKVFTGTQEQMKLNGNLKALDQRLLSLEEELTSLASILGGQRVFTDDPRLHPFLESVGLEVIATVDLGVNGAVSEEQRAAIAAQAANLPARILIVTHPEKKEQLGELAREADLTLVYFNPFYDGVTGVGQIDSVIPRQLRLLGLAMNAALASASTE